MGGPSDPETAGRSTARSASPGYGQVLQGVAAVVAPTTLLTSTAFYFGWARVTAFDGYFGVGPGTIDTSSRNYVLDSLNPLFLPVVVVLVSLIGLAFAHAFVQRVHGAGRRPRAMRRLAAAALLVGGAMLVVGALAAFGAFRFHVPYLIGTLFPAGGVVLLAYGIGIRSRSLGHAPLSTGARVLVGLFVALCLFWAAGLYAATVGRSQAATLAAHLDELPGVAVYSPSDLLLPAGHGLSLHRETSAAGGGPYVYTGLRLFAAVGGTLFLLPSRWQQHDGGALIVLPETDAMRVAFTPARESPPSGSVLGAALGAPPVQSAPPLTQRLGALRVEIDQIGTQATVWFENRNGRTVDGAVLDGTMARPAQPLVAGAGATCRIERTRFSCTLDAIPPHHDIPVRITFSGSRTADGVLTPRLGRRSFHDTISLGPA